MQPEEDDAGKRVGSYGQEISKVQVERQDYTSFLPCLFQNRWSGKTIQTFLTKVDNVMSMPAKGLNRAHRNADIRQTFHGRLLVSG